MTGGDEDKLRFSVEQSKFFSLELAWEYGRVLGRSRRRTVLGKLLIFPGAYLLFAGVLAVLGVLLDLREKRVLESPGEAAVVLAAGLLMTLWGVSWCGINRLPAALIRLLRRSRTWEKTRFFEGYVEDESGLCSTDYPYRAFQSVYEGRRAFFLLLGNKQVLILQKSGFAAGTPDAFRRFMDEKCGRAVIKV